MAEPDTTAPVDEKTVRQLIADGIAPVLAQVASMEKTLVDELRSRGRRTEQCMSVVSSAVTLALQPATLRWIAVIVALWVAPSVVSQIISGGITQAAAAVQSVASGSQP